VQGKGVRACNHASFAAPGQILTSGVLDDDESLEAHTPALSPAREIPKALVQVRRPPLIALVTDSQDAAGVARAYLEHRYTRQEIADHLGVHYATVSRRVRSVDSRRLRNTVRA
jgi:hypothetical protein